MEYGILLGTTLSSAICRLLIIGVCLISCVTAQYKWVTGAWSDCQSTCGSGHQIRDVQCFYEDKNLDLSLTENKHCQHLPRPPTHQRCFKECQDNSYEVVWAKETYGPCQLMPKVKNCSRGVGVQYRNVTCKFKSDGQLQDDSICESYQAKPITEKPCVLQCKQDCVVTTYGEWSSCDKCDSVARTRTRRVVIPNDHGGQECPPFSDIDLCTSCKNVYFISIEQWSPCVAMARIPENYPKHPLIGHHRRDVRCIDSTGARKDPLFCKKNIKLQGHTISDRESCIIPQDCEVSAWSNWNLLNSSCQLESGGVKLGFLRRQRSVKILPRGMGKACPALVQTSEVQGTSHGIQNCPRNRWITSGWSKCLAVNGGLQCSRGMQHRKAICIEENSESREQKPVDESFCTDPRPKISQLCPADCDWDCTVSLWSQWSECKVTECDQYARKRRNNQKTGQRYRTRDVLTPPGTNGRQCPHLSETQNCDPEPCYFWNTSSGPCSLSSVHGGVCGVGVAERTTTCVNRKGMGVRDELCSEWQTKPELRIRCVIPCPNDCVTSEWGQWSECPDICEENQEVAMRPNMRSRQKTILARAGRGGTSCPGERELVEHKQCPTVIECAVFIWHADPWGTCNLGSTHRKCGNGIMKREVYCYNKDNQLVQDEKCTQSVKPDTEKDCNIPCPKDCTNTSWSDWSPCSASCYKDKDNIPTRTRQRFILQEPDNGGLPCPEVLHQVLKCLDLPSCNQFQWKISNWSKCILAPSIHHCGKGLRARDITCMAQNGTDHPIEDCLMFLGPMPPIAEPCYISCDKQCLFTDWSEWSHCIQGCSGHQFRARILKGGSTIPKSCGDSKLYPTYEKRPCQLCETLKPTSMGEYSDCILDEIRHDFITNQPELLGRRKRNTTSLDMGYICGTGKRIKVVACMSKKNGIASADECSGAGYEEEICFIACPVDCEMSDWTTWSDCPAKCGAGVQTRHRSIRRLSSLEGRQCPSLGSSSKETQTRLCHPECIRYVWKSKAWSTCFPFEQRACGNGTQTRHVRCEAVNRHGFTTSIAPVEKCRGQVRPKASQSCYLYCIEDCVVSEWTRWTSCDQPCNPNARQVRTRNVLREGESPFYGRSKCPETRDYRQCMKGDNCIEYAWELSPWTTCLINNGLDDCGVGHSERYPICKNHFGQIVEDKFCEKVLGPVTEPLVVSCEEVCDVDCMVSDWSPWSSCSKTCGLGISQRDRSVVEQFSRNGRPCPKMLTQKKPCFLRGCYTWAVSDWSNCTGQVGICGNGIQTRNISCVSEDGIALDSSKCPPDLNILIMHTERPCKVPCPGECVLTEWTEWSKCYLSQADFIMEKYNDRGIQSRSRAILAKPTLKNEPCPEKLWEKRHCVAKEGMFFHWITSPWKGGNRTVWCQRSDGLTVIGGCDWRERPQTTLKCNPPCPAQSTCNDTNSCKCNTDYIPVYDSGVLECVDNKTLVKEAQESDEEKEESETSAWMYAVLAAGTVFIIFVALAFYNMSEHFRSGPRPRAKEDEEAAEKLNAETPQENGVDRLEHCPNVCTHNSAPTPANTNHLYENSNTNALWVRASTKRVRSRVARKFYSLLYFCGCSKHEHDTDYKETYTACLEGPVEDLFMKRIPDVEYSDRPTISNQSSVDIELTETSKKIKANGSDSAISMQNSSNDSRRTTESYASAGHASNYSRPDKRLKKYGNSFEKQRSFDSYVIAEDEVNDDENNIIYLKNVPAIPGKTSPKSLSQYSCDSKLTKRSARDGENSEDDNDSQNISMINNGSGMFTVHQNDSDKDESLVDEMNTFSRLLFSKRHQNSEESNTNNEDSVCLQEYKPSLATKPKLMRQPKIIQVDIEDVPSGTDRLSDNFDENISNDPIKRLRDSNEFVPNEQMKLLSDYDEPIKHSDDRDENYDSNGSFSELTSVHLNKSAHEPENEIVNSSKCDDREKYRSKSQDAVLENEISEDARADSWETFKDLVGKKCYNGRRKNKSSRTTTV